MTAPGNSAVLLILMAVVTVCVGYVAGRWHQWRRAAVDRDEAYQEGYDAGAESTFSMAARIAGPGRKKAAVRASAAVRAAAPGATSSSAVDPAPDQPFFAPRPVGASADPPSAGSPSPTSSPAGSSSSSPGAPASAAGPPVPGKATSSGRHFVPDELVRAATYRLAPDRVARAKVRGAIPPVTSETEAARPPVPKPRGS
jgi:hypothetical protein